MLTKSVCFAVMLRKSRLFFQITGRFFLLSLRFLESGWLSWFGWLSLNYSNTQISSIT